MQGSRSASGYQRLVTSTALGQIGYADRILEEVYERDWISEVTNMEFKDSLYKCHQTVQFLKTPNIGKWRPYDTNQQIIANQATPDSMCVTIDNAQYQAIKFDELDIMQACDNWDAYERSFKSKLANQVTEIWRTYVVTSMVLEAAGSNKGTKAGIYGDVNLGALGNPLTVTYKNIFQCLSRQARILRDTHRWEDGKMFAILPSAVEEVLARSNLSDASKMGACVQCSNNIDGFLPSKLAGFNIIISPSVPVERDASNKLGYAVIAGHRDAYGFAGDIPIARLTELERTFGVEYQMLTLYGGAAFYPDALSVAYWTLDTSIE